MLGSGFSEIPGPVTIFPSETRFLSFGCATFVKLNKQPGEILHAAPLSSSQSWQSSCARTSEAGKTNGIIWAGMDAP